MRKKICPVCQSDRVGTFPYLGRGDFAMCFDCGAQGQLSKPEEWKPFHEPEIIDVISSDLWDKATRRADDARNSLSHLREEI